MKEKFKHMFIYAVLTPQPWYKFWLPGSGIAGGLVWFVLGLLVFATSYLIHR